MSRIFRASALLAFVLLSALSIGGPAAAVQQPPKAGKAIPKAWAEHNRAKGGAKGDPDRDGLTNWGEFRSHTKPRRADTNRDGLRDGKEDYDGDGVRNRAEVAAGSDPGVKDAGRFGDDEERVCATPEPTDEDEDNYEDDEYEDDEYDDEDEDEPEDDDE